MTFQDIGGNERLIQRLVSAISGGKTVHAYIMEGDMCVDKSLIANCFAKAVLCKVKPGIGCDDCFSCEKINHANHEDILHVEPDEAGSVKDEGIEDLQTKLKRIPYGGDRHIAIIHGADTMTVRAQNRLLKTLEEPASGTILLLLSENIENLAKTIVSRCAVFHWNPFLTPEYGELMSEAETLVQMLLEQEPFYKAKMRIMALADSKEKAYKLLDAMEVACEKLLLDNGSLTNCYSKSAIGAAIEAIEEARRDLRRGMQLGYTLKSMILTMEESKW